MELRMTNYGDCLQHLRTSRSCRPRPQPRVVWLGIRSSGLSSGRLCTYLQRPVLSGTGVGAMQNTPMAAVSCAITQASAAAPGCVARRKANLVRVQHWWMHASG